MIIYIRNRVYCKYLLISDEFGAEMKDGDEDFVDAEGDGWGGDDDLDLEVFIYYLH